MKLKLSQQAKEKIIIKVLFTIMLILGIAVGIIYKEPIAMIGFSVSLGIEIKSWIDLIIAIQQQKKMLEMMEKMAELEDIMKEHDRDE